MEEELESLTWLITHSIIQALSVLTLVIKRRLSIDQRGRATMKANHCMDRLQCSFTHII